MSDTPGARLYLIRLACGDGVRTAEPMREFAQRVKRATGADYNPMKISLLERMKQNWRLEDVTAFAAADPLGRGRAWLATFDGDAHREVVPKVGDLVPDPRPKMVADPRKAVPTSKPAKRGRRA